MNTLLGSSKSFCVSYFMFITQVHALFLEDLTVNVKDFEIVYSMKKGHVNLSSLGTKRMNTGQLL